MDVGVCLCMQMNMNSIVYGFDVDIGITVGSTILVIGKVHVPKFPLV